MMPICGFGRTSLQLGVFAMVYGGRWETAGSNREVVRSNGVIVAFVSHCRTYSLIDDYRHFTVLN